MDEENRWGLKYIIPNDPYHKVHTLLEYAGLSRDISDPWYTGNFKETYSDITLGLNAFYKHLMNE